MGGVGGAGAVELSSNPLNPKPEILNPELWPEAEVLQLPHAQQRV